MKPHLIPLISIIGGDMKRITMSWDPQNKCVVMSCGGTIELQHDHNTIEQAYIDLCLMYNQNGYEAWGFEDLYA